MECIKEQADLGNYANGAMQHSGYPLLQQNFLKKAKLLHDKSQFRNRIRQLKGMYTFIKDIRFKRTGLGCTPDGWPIADDAWWESVTKVQESETVIRISVHCK